MKFVDAPRKLYDSLRERGLKRTWQHSVQWLRYHYFLYQENSFDRLYGTDTTAKVQPEDFGVSSKSLAYASPYEAVTADVFDRMIRVIPIDHKKYIFIDLGSGKGRALMYAANFPFGKMIGVEFSPKLHEIARANISRFQSKVGHKDFELHCLPAEEYVFPALDTVLFLYNPFQAPVIASVLSRLEASLRIHPRDLILLYRNPLFAELFDKQPFLQSVCRNSEYGVYRNIQSGIGPTKIVK
jgi:hypothetical protein